GSGEGLRIVERMDEGVVDAEAHGVPVAALDFEAVRTPLSDRLRARILRARNQPELPTIRTVFVQARKDVQAVLPTAEDDNVARCVHVGSALRRARPIAPNLGLDVAVRRSARRDE